MAWEMLIKQERRLCKVNGEYGYFHTWEYVTRTPKQRYFANNDVVNTSNLFGIVEFPDRVQRVDPEHIMFCDEDNEFLKNYNEKGCKND